MALLAFTSINASLPTGASSASQPFPCTHDCILPKGPFLISHVPIITCVPVTADCPHSLFHFVFLLLVFLCLPHKTLLSASHGNMRRSWESENLEHRPSSQQSNLQLQEHPSLLLKQLKFIVLDVSLVFWLNCQTTLQGMYKYIHFKDKETET